MARARFPFVETVFADGGYAGRFVVWAKDTTHVTLQIISRMPWMKVFVVIRRPLSRFETKPREGNGWVVERAFAWIMKCRRLAREYEQLPRIAEILIAASATLVGHWP